MVLSARGALLCGATLLAACSDSLSDRFSVQQEGEGYFVREKRGWFSAIYPCKPSFSKVVFGASQVRMIHSACDSEGQAFSITFGRFMVPELAEPSAEQVYEAAVRGLESWRQAPRSQASLATVAGRPARYLTFSGIDGAAVNAHIWFLWAEEQRAIYQVMAVGTAGPTEGERLARSLVVPSP